MRDLETENAVLRIAIKEAIYQLQELDLVETDGLLVMLKAAIGTGMTPEETKCYKGAIKLLAREGG